MKSTSMNGSASRSQAFRRGGEGSSISSPSCAKTRSMRLRGFAVIELEQAAESLTTLHLTGCDHLCRANIASRRKSIDVGVAGRHSTRQCEPSSRRVLRSDRLGRRVATSCSRLLPCATNSLSSLVRIGASARLTGCVDFAVHVALRKVRDAMVDGGDLRGAS
jgi:hypothetical protein